ncbi:hypothetical protein GOBAR_AA34594 [Gossypium barbadense]|uniref:Serine-threonine/tyrosine-protein kinase catalytic domain-containing protein n=1 Tax=Gossypium barbadense TaxID=3634 RepID=A0A2P5W4R5_GOSBA|nr:hypothetical protein GOBAR_AA34594 [Gossypium barbadense]
MEPSKKHFQPSRSFFLVILLSFFNLQGFNLLSLATASPLLSSLSIVLSLSSNSLTGEHPVEVEKLKNLGQLDVSHNRLSGLLTNNLGSCVSLVEIYLEGNLFEGPISPYLSSLRGLEALDASNNNLSGGIPEFLVRFGSLKYLNLSFNNFEGVIQSEGVFKNTSAIFVEGDNKLCGGIPESDFCILYSAKKEQKPTTTHVENSLLRLSYQSILRATNGFSPQNLVGLGGFGSVYKGILEANRAVIAVKVLNLLNHRASRSFLVECEALKNIRHRNLVKMLLTHWNICTIVVRRRSFIVTSSQAMFYSIGKCSLGLRGTIGYAPPEYGTGSELSTNGDLYSYGILLLEMLTGKRPTNERFKEGLSLHNFVKAALPNRVVEIIDPILLQESVRGGTVADITLNENNLGNDEYLQCLNSIFKIGLTCSAESPSERMDMSDVVTKLCSIRDKLLRPTRLDRGIKTAYSTYWCYMRSQASKSHKVETSNPQTLWIIVTLHWKFELPQGVGSCGQQLLQPNSSRDQWFKKTRSIKPGQ